MRGDRGKSAGTIPAIRRTLRRPPFRRMRILHCTDTWPPQLNGASVVTATTVAGLQTRGWHAAVIAPREHRPASHPDAALDLTTVPSTGLPIYPEVRVAMPDYAAVTRAIRRFQPDLVHCRTAFVLAQLGSVAAKRAGVAVVTSLRTDFPGYARACGFGWLNPAIRGYLSRFHRRARRTGYARAV